MIGAIVLTFRKREGVKRQSYINQISRHRENSISLEEVKFKSGVKLMINVELGHYLSLGGVIFLIGIAGIFLNRKNVIVILMSIELILLAVNINLVAFSIYAK